MQETLDTLSKEEMANLICMIDESICEFVEREREFAASGIDWKREFIALSIINEALRGLGCKSAMADKIKMGPNDTTAGVMFAVRINRQVFGLSGKAGWKPIEMATAMQTPSPSVDRNFYWKDIPREKFERSHPILIVNIDPEDPEGAMMDKVVAYVQREIEAHVLAMKAQPALTKNKPSTRL